MEIVLLPQAEADRDFWKRTGNKAVMKHSQKFYQDLDEAEQAIANGEGKTISNIDELNALFYNAIATIEK